MRVLAARFEAGCLLVGYSPLAAEVTECLVDDTVAEFVSVEKGVVSVSCAAEPKVVVVRARLAGEPDRIGSGLDRSRAAVAGDGPREEPD